MLDIIAGYPLHFGFSTETGRVFHLMGVRSEFGKLGITRVGNSLEEAKPTYVQAIQVLDQASGLKS
ncbi:peptide ligase PGM1-related protein [Synechococcus sp. PCC 6312]|uniref:peptide ligase PGM1-related protein n=1 Tax=Synechococcus sp. (strain ATCC 27167 / PCC 6312) TaxID=195253 RepID=UPI0002F4A6D9|nr:hypothetical protein [Synechococcus sp. PCC 6312]